MGTGYAVMDSAVASGEKRALKATQLALANPLLEGASINAAPHILLNITGSAELRIQELKDVTTLVEKAAADSAIISCAAIYDASLGDSVRVTVILPGNKSLSLADQLPPSKRATPDP
jgi:cell division protein FtsZ